MLYREDRLPTPAERAELVALAYEHLMAPPLDPERERAGVSPGPSV
jgi:hypothetical protein